VLRVVLGTWLALLAAMTVLFVLVSGGQALVRAARARAGQVRPAVEQRPAEQSSAA